FEVFLLPDGARPRFLSVMPAADEIPDSSLAFMITDLLECFGAPGSAAFATGAGLDYDALESAAAEAAADGAVVLLIGTSAAFIHWLDRLADDGRSFRLPEGSRLMDTGGFKGRGRRVEPDELRAAYHERLGLDPACCVNEYGMTEMLSQLYDTGLLDRVRGLTRPPRKAGPPWVRSLAVDPETLAPLPPGEPGLLRHLDLANAGSVPAVQTEDYGAVDEHGLVLHGRAVGAPPRGCSIAMDILLENAP
ncbi:MAG TPA: acyl-protein synthetase, partial [Alphaproteobacteria bacterium]|nr:acyl-protein synthetase [Alphaproteobacteria bacterium]